MSAITFAAAKKLTLDRLRQVRDEMPVAERRRPRYVINFKTYSVLDLIAQVERETTIGKEYVFDQAKQMNYVVT
ncbi:unnamed protein product [marine sediment metagenome]|uniref:Uncharacterized protein n=1 Tax=marine sediment metagenome TaxID=412755 RepID=X1Q5G2_9ZZZZ